MIVMKNVNMLISEGYGASISHIMSMQSARRRKLT